MATAMDMMGRTLPAPRPAPTSEATSTPGMRATKAIKMSVGTGIGLRPAR